MYLDPDKPVIFRLRSNDSAAFVNASSSNNNGFVLECVCACAVAVSQLFGIVLDMVGGGGWYNDFDGLFAGMLLLFPWPWYLSCGLSRPWKSGSRALESGKIGMFVSSLNAQYWLRKARWISTGSTFVLQEDLRKSNFKYSHHCWSEAERLYQMRWSILGVLHTERNEKVDLLQSSR